MYKQCNNSATESRSRTTQVYANIQQIVKYIVYTAAAYLYQSHNQNIP